MKKLVFGLAAIAAVALTPILAGAHGGASGVVKERMDLMKVMGDDMKRISDMLHGKAAYDVAEVRKAALSIAARGGEDITRLFPQGTDHPPSEALPTIWRQPDRFAALAGDLVTHAKALAEAAGNERAVAAMGSAEAMMGMGAMMGGAAPAEEPATMAPETAFMRLTDTCAACHETFRAEKKSGH